MKNSILFILLLMSPYTFAGSIHLRVPDFEMNILDEKVLLHLDVDNNQQYIDLLRQLKELKNHPKIQRGESLSNPILIKNEETISLDITSWLNSSLKKILLQKRVQNGPNCWNGALYFSQITPHTRYTHSDEFHFWLDSPLCHEVLLNENLEPGDIGAVRTNIHKGRGLNAEHHAFIYLSEDIMLERSLNAPYRMVSFSNIIKTWDLNEEHLKCLRVSGKNTRNCNTYIQYFRCESMPTYEVTNADNIGKELQEFARRVDALEAEVEKLVFLPTQFDAVYDALTKRFQLLRLELDEHFFSKEIPLGQTQKIFLKGLYLRLSSSLRTISNLGFSYENRSKQLLQLEKEIPQWKGLRQLG